MTSEREIFDWALGSLTRRSVPRISSRHVAKTRRFENTSRALAGPREAGQFPRKPPSPPGPTVNQPTTEGPAR